MSHLDTLNLMADSPAKDYHLHLFRCPEQQPEIYNFFLNSRNVEEIRKLEAQLAALDKQCRDQNPVVLNKWATASQQLKVHRAIYKNRLDNFQAEILNCGDNNGAKPTPTQQSAAEYLLSVAGTFNSGTTDTSMNVKRIVADYILEKYNKKD